MSDSPLLQVEELSVVFRTRRGLVTALHDVSLQVDKGEILGVVGESGSGKSVTAYTVMGILDSAGTVANGRIRLAGTEWRSAAGVNLDNLRGRVMSMIFQSPRAALNPIRPVGRQIGDVLRTHTDVSKPAIAGAVIELLRKVRIREPERRYWAYPYELSGGMCQRVLIAMALACEPALLIADEPTTGLDVTTQKAIIDLIVDLAAQRDMATILITHDLGLAAQYCDRIVVMQAGRIVESALTTELFLRPSHDYTRKLIAATPRTDSCLADLVPGNVAAEAAPTSSFCAESSANEATLSAATGSPQPAEPLLEVRDLVRDYAVRPHGGWWQRQLAQPAQSASQAARFRAVDGISLHIMPGESVGLVGESGCGKSTTAQMIARLLDPTSGSIRFQGEEIGSVPVRQFVHQPQRAQIQMVFQDPSGSLNPRQSAFDAIAEPLRRLARLRRAAALSDTVHELAYVVGLPPELLSRRPHQLSGGQKARVGIARAIALKPKLLLLDEPTSALDVSVQALVLCLLDRLRRQLGMSYLFVSHDLLVVRLLCDRVLVMNSGRIVDGGPAEILLSKPTHDYTRSLIEAVPHFRPGCAA